MSNFDQYHAKFVAETLSYYCSNNFELEVWTELELSKESLEDSPYDIIISNPSKTLAFFVEDTKKAMKPRLFLFYVDVYT
ncbi:transcriptional activator [Streptococcus pneumoniae]|nr:transcriptional activator [Streptococcus pneumoniae]